MTMSNFTRVCLDERDEKNDCFKTVNLVESSPKVNPEVAPYQKITFIMHTNCGTAQTQRRLPRV